MKITALAARLSIRARLMFVGGLCVALLLLQAGLGMQGQQRSSAALAMCATMR